MAVQNLRCLHGAAPPRRDRREQLRRFVSWLTGKQTQAEIDGTATGGRTFRRDTAWCWDIQPRLRPTTQIHHAVLVDGIWIGTWCLLLAISDKGNLLTWQWYGRIVNYIADQVAFPEIDVRQRLNVSTDYGVAELVMHEGAEQVVRPLSELGLWDRDITRC